MIFLANGGELELLDKMLKDALSVDEDYSLRLFKNSAVSYAESTTTGTFTVADFTGYSNKTLTRAGWGAASTVNGRARSVYGTQQTWTNSGSAQTVYGYYIVGVTSGILLWWENFTTPIALNPGDSLPLTPVFSLTGEYNT